ncbi:GFA family protein [Litorimonas sp.]|uniref:GFA family protein n=1 Tax=Litorimonas sp. TaxID=1892381 RepID=UPI003A8A63E6
MTKLIGKCLCGSVRVSAKGGVTDVEACHCGMCRRQNGGGAYYGVHFSDGVIFEGESAKWLSTSEWGERGFCTNCGSTIGWRRKTARDQASVSAGLFDDFEARVGLHIFTDEGPAYTTIPHDAPHKTSAQAIK